MPASRRSRTTPRTCPAGRRVALLTTHGPELPEFGVPVTYLRERGDLPRRLIDLKPA